MMKVKAIVWLFLVGLVAMGCCPKRAHAQVQHRTTGMYMSAETLPNWGTSEPAIRAAFPANVVADCKDNAEFNASFERLSDYALATLTAEMYANDPSTWSLWHLIECAIPKLSAANLRRFEAAVGPTAITTDLHLALPEVQAQYAALSAQPPLVGGFWYVWINGPWHPTSRGAHAPMDLTLLYTLARNEDPTLSLARATRYTNMRMSAKQVPLPANTPVIEVGPDIFRALQWYGLIFSACQAIDPNCVRDVADWASYPHYMPDIVPGPFGYQPATITVTPDPSMIGEYPPDLATPTLPPIAPPDLISIIYGEDQYGGSVDENTLLQPE